MASRNDITGDTLVSRNSTAVFRDNWDRIFNKESTNEESLDGSQIAMDDFADKMDQFVLSGLFKEVYLEQHNREVKRVFEQLYPETKLSDEQIKLIVLMWEEQVKEQHDED